MKSQSSSFIYFHTKKDEKTQHIGFCFYQGNDIVLVGPLKPVSAKSILYLDRVGWGTGEHCSSCPASPLGSDSSNPAEY